MQHPASIVVVDPPFGAIKPSLNITIEILLVSAESFNISNQR
jgi:hypothetical protein